MEEQSVAVQYFLPFTVAMIMFAMGLGLVVDDFRRIFEKPRAVMIGLGAQLVLLPVLGFAVAFGFGLRPELAVGLVLLSACPGGAHSNLYASFARADVALSVALTAVSGLVTIVTIPAVPVALGMLIRARSERWAGRLERVVKGFAIVMLRSAG